MTQTSLYRTLASFIVCCMAAACSGPEEVPDPCEPQDQPSVVLGKGVGGLFAQFVDEEDVGLTVAPQGGFGVQTVIRTYGLDATQGATVDALLEVQADGQDAGSFLLEGAPLQCADGVGGQLFGQVVGFDPDVYQTNDDLLALDGSVVILDVSVTDSTGVTVTARQPVTVRVGG